MVGRFHRDLTLERDVATSAANLKRYILLLLASFLQASVAIAAPREIDAYHWTGVERIVAIGDLHGDYQSYLLTLKSAGLIDERDRWSGGNTHLVQLGDIPDRGAETLKIIAHMETLSRQAAKKGGRVHNLMGNHEAMNTYGDLRYVSAGEFAAFSNNKSAALRDRYYENVLADIKTRDPEKFANLPEGFRDEWDKTHPLGWVEHQQAWNPRWNPDGRYFEWVMDTEVAIQINDMIFLHGGLSSAYCQNSLASLTEKARAALRESNPSTPSILTDQLGPLWYRGLSGVEPEASSETVDAILAQNNARHIIVGHTPTEGAIWPRYATRVIQVDTGLSAHYGGHIGYLEVNGEKLFAGYPAGRIEIPDDDAGRLDYLHKVIALQPENQRLQKQLAELQHPPTANGKIPDPETGSEVGAAMTAAEALPPTCGISP